MALEITTAPTFEPVTLAELKAFADIAHGRADDDLNRNITTARRHVEDTLGVTLGTTTYTLYLDRWPKKRYGFSDTEADAIVLPRPPVTSVTSIKYLDEDGTQQTWAADQYRTDLVSQPARITRAYSIAWPTFRAVTNTIEIKYVAGAAQADIRTGLKQLVLWIAKHLYERTDLTVERSLSALPLGIEMLMAQESHGFIAEAISI